MHAPCLLYDAEEYHQDYLDKNPAGYCHINLLDADEFIAEEMGEEVYVNASCVYAL